MNTRIVAAIAALVILSLGGFLFLNSRNTPQNQTSTTASPVPTQSTNEQSSEQSSPQSLLDLVTSGSNMQCSFNSENPDGSLSSGTVYINKDKMRGNFTLKANGKENVTYLIRDGDTNYIWGFDTTAGGPAGIKLTMSFEDLDTNTMAKQYFDADQKVDYNCQPWSIDNSQFTPPANVKFTDYSSLMESIDKMER